MISVFLVDDAPRLRELLRYSIDDDPRFEVVGEAGDGRSAIEGISETQPEAVLLDLGLPDMGGIEAIPQIRSRQPRTAIVIFSAYPFDEMGPKAEERGADAYVEKGTSLEELREVTRRAVAERDAA